MHIIIIIVIIIIYDIEIKIFVVAVEDNIYYSRSGFEDAPGQVPRTYVDDNFNEASSY